jgi:hypothetical protein
MSKLAVVTAAFGEGHLKLAATTLPSIRAYANRLGAELVVLGEALFWGHPHWEKFQLAEVLKRVDRVAWIDIDAIVNPKAHSVFDAVPIGSFGALYDVPFHRMDYHGHVALTQQLLGMSEASWDWNYANMGVFVCDAAHNALFNKPSVLARGGLPEQTYLNLRRSELGIRFHDITSEFNNIREWLCPTTEAQLTSSIVHYAGWLGRRDVLDSVTVTIQQAKKDLAVWEKFSV